MAYFKDFPYVDAHYVHPHTNRRMPWKRILRKNIETELRNPSLNLNCFCTVQFFSDAVINKDKDQTHYCPVYFDFDAKPANYDGDVMKARAASKLDTSKLIAYLISMGIAPPQIKVWFSGDKGFHVTVHPDVFAIKPHKHLTYIFRYLATYLKEALTLTTMDQSVYTLPRQWRLANSIHQNSNLYKIELYSNRLTETSVEDITKEAKSPRQGQLWGREENESVEPVDDAVEWFNGFVDRYHAQEELKLLKPKLPILKTEEWPVCVKDIYDNGPKRNGSRNQATLALACYFKDTGKPMQETIKLLTDWNKKHLTGEGDRKYVERDANMRSVVRAVYNPRDYVTADKAKQADSYYFACHFMWALKGIGKDKQVACVGPRVCPTIQGMTPQEKELNVKPSGVPMVLLNQVGSATFNGQSVRFAFHVSGKAKDSYIVPRAVTATCTPAPQTDLCKNCPNVKTVDGEMDEKNSAGLKSSRTVELNQDDRVILALVDIPDEQRRTKLRNVLGIPARCTVHDINVDTEGDLEKIKLIPLVDDTGIYVPLKNAESATSGIVNGLDEEHVVMQAYHLVEVGGGKKIKANQKYVATGIPYASPKDQSATVLIYDYQSAQDDVESFTLTETMHQQLKVFQVASRQTVAEKMDDIHEDLEINIHCIYGRRDVAIALDMSYHSVLKFKFQERPVKKGWVELLIIGDTGQGKTELVRSMIHHYGLGEMTGGEGAKRTGLVWAQVQDGKGHMLEWGKIPQNDKRLLVIDEFSGMSKEFIGEMTRLRSEGIAESQGINQQETNARCRLVLLTNPRDGHPMNRYDHGAEAIRGLCDSVADIRRIDIAVAVAQSDMKADVANQLQGKRTKDAVYTADLCKNLILFAWSRKENDVVWEEGTVPLILDAAKTMGPKFECRVGLVSTSDQRLKIARLAIACAARLYSVAPLQDDEKVPTRLLVKKEHVDFVVKLLNRVYTAKNMQLDKVAAKEKVRANINPSEDKRIRKEIRRFTNWQELVAALLETGYWRKDSLSETTGMSKDEVSEFTRWAFKNKLIQSPPGGYRKNPVFTEILKRIDVNGDEDKDEVGDEPAF